MKIEINIGIENSSGKWVAELRLPNGDVRSTGKRYNTRAELEREIDAWVEENGIVIEETVLCH